MNKFGRKEPLVLKTYGKYSRKVERWLSPDVRKVAFASTSSSDLSIGEQIAQKNMRKRKKTLSTASSRPSRAAKKKALGGLQESDSDEENVFNPTPVHSIGTNRKRRGTLSVKALPKLKMAVRESTSESEEETATRSRALSCASGASGQGSKAGNSVLLSSYLSRFVTDRRRGAPKMPKGSQPSQTRKKPSVSIGNGSLNSSEDFVQRMPRPRRLAPARRTRTAHSGNASSELASPVPMLSRARSILQAVSLNSTSDRPLGSDYKKPLLSSTPSISARPSYRHQEPSISEISCSIDDMEEVFKTSMDGTRSLRSPGLRELKVVLERSAEIAGNVRKRSPESEKVGLPLSAVESRVGGPRRSRELSSRVGRESVFKDGARTAGASPCSENPSVQFVSAESRLDSLAASVRERGVAVVVLERSDLSKRRSGGGAERGEDTYSSCLDSESALRSSGSEDGPRPGVEAPGPTERVAAGYSGCSPGDDPGRIQEADEGCGAGSGSPGCGKSPSVVCISPTNHPGSLGESGDGGLFGETGCGLLGTGTVSGHVGDSGSGVSVAEQSRDLFLDGWEGEPQDRSGATLPAAGPPLPEEAAVISPSQPARMLEASLKKRCTSVPGTVVLEALDLSGCIQARAYKLVPGSGSVEEPQREARSSESDRGRSPVSSDSREQPESSSPEGLRRVNTGQDAGKPDVGLRRRLSSAFTAKQSAATPASASPPGGKKRPAKARNQGGGPPKDRPGTGRKACVSGFSVSRWAKNDPRRQRPKKHHSQSQLSRGGDCSLFDFQPRPEAKKQPDVGSSLFQAPGDVFLGTPLRTEPLNISSLLANFTPESLTTHTWSRLKAALSVHKKKKAFFTPKKLNLSHPEVQAEGSLDGSVRLLPSPHSTPLSHSLRPSLLRSALATPMSPSLLFDDITDAEKLYLECQQEGPITFEQCIPPPRMKLCKKVGEGTFGEVFTTTNDANETVALKIVPIEGKQKVNGEEQKTFGEILHEVIISKELSSLDAKEINNTSGFIGLNNLHCVRGSYPMLLLSAWDKFDKQRRSENDRPDFFGEDQLFLILEFEFGGNDLEAMSGKLSSLAVAKSILHQVTAALAVAEEALCFEHRDLHWGNILVRATKEKTSTYVLNGKSHSMETKGMHVNIIDYSLSRLEIDGLTVSCDISADEELFLGKGDYQFDIYRQMRQENNNSWSEFNPHTNVLWLHYLADKLLHMSYRTRAQTKPMKELKKSIQDFHRELLAYKSAANVLESCSLFQEA